MVLELTGKEIKSFQRSDYEEEKEEAEEDNI